MNVWDSGELALTISSGLATLTVTNFRGRLDHIIVDVPLDTTTYFIEILSLTGKTIFLDQGTGDHTFTVNMTMGKNFIVRLRNVSDDGAAILELTGEQGVK